MSATAIAGIPKCWPIESRRRPPGPVRATDPVAAVGRANEVVDDVSALANSAAVAKRSAGSLDSAIITAFSTVSGTVSRVAEIGVGRCVIILETIAWTLLPVKGASPVSIS